MNGRGRLEHKHVVNHFGAGRDGRLVLLDLDMGCWRGLGDRVNESAGSAGIDPGDSGIRNGGICTRGFGNGAVISGGLDGSVNLSVITLGVDGQGILNPTLSLLFRRPVVTGLDGDVG
jgi:hypothetical protein